MIKSQKQKFDEERAKIKLQYPELKICSNCANYGWNGFMGICYDSGALRGFKSGCSNFKLKNW